MEQANKIRAIFGTGFALLLGVGIAAVFQTFTWNDSVRTVAGIYETLNHLDAAALAEQSAHEEAHRFAASGDRAAAVRCLEELTQARVLVTSLGVGVPMFQVAEFQSKKGRLSALVDEQDTSLRAALNTPPLLLPALRARDSSGVRSQLQNAFGVVHDQVRQMLDQRLLSQYRVALRARSLFVTAGLICIVLIVVAGWRFSFDLDRREKFGRARAVQNEHYRQAVELATEMIARLDEQGRFVYCNPAFLSLLHYSQEEVVGRSYTRLVRLDMRRDVEHFYMRQAARKRKTSYYEFPVIDGYGRERWIGQNVQVLIEGTKLVGFQAISREITERRRTEMDFARSLNLLEGVAAATPGILYVFDLMERKTVFANRELTAVLGYKQDTMQGDFDQMAVQLFHPDDLSALSMHHETLRRARAGDVQRIEYRARHADGNWVWLSAWETPFQWDQDGRVRQVVGIAQDVTVHNAAREKLTWQANYDNLTRLANRQHFWTRLQSVLRRASMEHMPVALCLFDIDRFKEINDRFGHTAGDEVLEAIGTIVRSEMRSDDASGRLGGDEFCFILPNADQEEAARIAERIRERLNTMAFGMNAGSAFSASATFGVSSWQPHMGARELMEAADRALYRAKASGRNRVCVEA